MRGQSNIQDMTKLGVDVADAQPAPEVRANVEQTTCFGDVRCLILSAVDKAVSQPFRLSLDMKVWCMRGRKWLTRSGNESPDRKANVSEAKRTMHYSTHKSHVQSHVVL
jgi:hypothetical protein